MREKKSAVSVKNPKVKAEKVFQPKKVTEPTGNLNQKKDVNSIREIKENIHQESQAKGDEEINLDDKPATPFTPEAFEKVWKASVQRLKKQHNQTLYAAFLAHKPKLEKPFVIRVFLENHIQMQDLDQHKTDLLGFIREQLNNWKIDIKASMIDEDVVDEKGKQYDNKEKFKQWAEKNPGLMELKKKFNLDIDL